MSEELNEIRSQLRRLSRLVEAVVHTDSSPDEYACVANDPDERFYISLNRGSMCRWRVIDRKKGGLRYIAMFREYDHAENYVAWCKENMP